MKSLKHELQDLIQGNGGKEQESLIQTTTGFLRRSKTTSADAQKGEYSKEQETKTLVSFIDSNLLWYQPVISEDTKIGEGAEQKVYYNAQTASVIKLNDSIYFSFWEDYFYNLLLHNYFFPTIKYTLLGFILKSDVLYAVVEQPYVRATEQIDLDYVKEFLNRNGFENTRLNDYYNRELGIILEDLHDENVISSGEVLHFIDTVFYLTPDFYK
jgi:hypothetical protein